MPFATQPAHQRDDWHNRRHQRQRARDWLADHTTWPTPCAKCGTILGRRDPWHLGHILSRREHPDQMWNPANWQVECATCSRRDGARLGRNLQLGRTNQDHDDPDPGTPPAQRRGPIFDTPPKRAALPSPVLSPRNDLGLAADAAEWSGNPWMSALIGEMGPEDVWPRIMTGPHPLAVGSYGPQWVERIEARRAGDVMVPAHEKRLRWFQRLVVVRAGEHDAEGRLVWESVLMTSNRQVGKSVLVREMALDRMNERERLGEEQLVLHIARDLQVAEEVQFPARLWARLMQQAGVAGFKALDTNGKAAVFTPGGRWLARSEKGAYGYSASMAPVDECWDIALSTVTNGISKTMAARREPQLWLLSTAHEGCTPLFPHYRERALAEVAAPVGTLLVEWSAVPGSADDDESAWRAASPWYDERRRDLIGKDVGSPGFREQWLNVWPERVEASQDVPVLPGWEALGVSARRPVGGVAALDESWEGSGFGVCLLSGDDCWLGVFGSLPDAVAAVVASRPRLVGVGMSLRDAAVLAGLSGVQVEGLGTGHTQKWTWELRKVVAGGRLRHNHDPVAGEQVAGLVLRDSEAGPVLSGRRSREDILLPKLLLWALGLARDVPDVRPQIW